MPKLGAPEIILIVIVLLLLFGSKKIPDLARSLGKSMNEFRKGREESSKEDVHEDDTPKKPV